MQSFEFKQLTEQHLGLNQARVKVLVIGVPLRTRAGARLKIRAVLTGKLQTKLLALRHKLGGNPGLHRIDLRFLRLQGEGCSSYGNGCAVGPRRK